jgi:AraC-like DNA-binding protein
MTAGTSTEAIDAAPSARPQAENPACPLRLLHRRLPAGQAEAPHQHPWVELVHVQAGRGLLTVGARTHRVAAQTVSVVPPGDIHSLAADGQWTCTAHLLHFDPAALAPPPAREALQAILRAAAQGRSAASLRGPGQSLALLLIHAARAAQATDGGAAARETLTELCLQLHHHLGTALSAGGPPRRGPRPEVPVVPARPEVERALQYIEENLTRSISRQELAREVSFAPSYFSAIFRQATGSSIPEYINARRVRRAQELLRDPSARVSAVCYAVGFRDLTNFNRVFKRVVGATPREYRKRVLDGADDPGGGAAATEA